MPDTGADAAPARHAATATGFRSAAGFLAYLAQRFQDDRCIERASALTFSTVLALVPLIAISFAVFSAFPAYETLKLQVQEFVFENFVPGVGMIVSEHLDQFTKQTGELTIVGVTFLGVSAVLLLVTINQTFNDIWRVSERRSVVGRLLTFWAVITLAPILFGISLSLSSYLFTIAQETGVESVTGSVVGVARLAPALLAVAGFAVLYLVLPSYPVRRRDALLGGLVAGILFEALKKAFGFYVQTFPTYETIYGTLAAIPILLMWIYLAWVVVLIGAELTAALPAWRTGMQVRHGQPVAPAQRLALALGLLGRLDADHQQGRSLSTRVLTRAVPGFPDAVTSTLERLQRGRFITRDEQGRWLIARNLEAVTAAELIDMLHLRLRPEDLPDRQPAGQLCPLLQQIEAREAELLTVPVRELLNRPDTSTHFIATVGNPRDEAPHARNEGSRDGQVGDGDSEEQSAAQMERRHGRLARITAFLGLAWIGSR